MAESNPHQSDRSGASAPPEATARPVVNGPVDGNAFAVLGAARTAMRRAGWSKERIDALTKRAMSGDYNNLLATLMEEVDFNL